MILMNRIRLAERSGESNGESFHIVVNCLIKGSSQFSQLAFALINDKICFLNRSDQEKSINEHERRNKRLAAAANAAESA